MSLKALYIPALRIEKFSSIGYILTLILLYSSLSAQNKYNVELLPDSILNEATQIIRNYDLHYNVEAQEAMIESVNLAITYTSLNENSITITVPYNDQFDKIKNLTIRYYDQGGNLIGKASKKDIHDIKAYDGFSIATNARLKYIDYRPTGLPITVEYSYERHTSSTVTVRDWPLYSYGVYIENSNLTIDAYEGYEIAYKEMNLKDYSQHFSLDYDNHSFSCHDLKIPEYEYYAPSYKKTLPHLMTSPRTFCFGNSIGAFKDWKGYGK